MLNRNTQKYRLSNRNTDRNYNRNAQPQLKNNPAYPREGKHIQALHPKVLFCFYPEEFKYTLFGKIGLVSKKSFLLCSLIRVS